MIIFILAARNQFNIAIIDFRKYSAKKSVEGFSDASRN